MDHMCLRRLEISFGSPSKVPGWSLSLKMVEDRAFGSAKRDVKSLLRGEPHFPNGASAPHA
jgi:hypothetical protein